MPRYKFISVSSSVKFGYDKMQSGYNIMPILRGYKRMFNLIRNLFFLVTIFSIAACSSSRQPKPSQNSNNHQETQDNEQNPSVGGWAPVFLTYMDESQLNEIAEELNSGRIKRIVISYPTKMESLAESAHDYLLQKTNVDIPLKSIELKDTDQVKYNLTQIILTLYFN